MDVFDDSCQTYLRKRLNDVEESLNILDIQLQNREISGPEYSLNRHAAIDTRKFLVAELEKLGIIEHKTPER